ncbi:tripartite tricarboxylate transporter substrate binding protein [Tamaricihabitans halophyticus]|uniref:tripartite tricarboxylate transporter substrate binding protein n=1 Tax=Tamaricihabitans halophyticus TaxID=1262583 RepID=UPI0014053973|nr:tripartite tricarboxylate transporter substrate binding protein [Tamaricihabitans halophyticus]
MAVLLTGSCAGSDSTDETQSSGGGHYPTRGIEFVVPFDAGGGTDQLARRLAAAAERTCGTNIIVTNKSGGSGLVGLTEGLAARPDGYTLVLATSSTLLASHFGISDVSPEDITAVAKINEDPSVLSVAAGSPYRSIEDFLAAARDGERLLVSTSGSGSIWELSFAGMARAADVPPMVNVPYEGAGPALIALLGGEVDATSISGVESRTQIEQGSVRPLAVMGDERLAFLPDVPTLKESGIDWVSTVWRGLAVAPGVPQPVVDRLDACMAEAYRDKGFQAWMRDQGYGLSYQDAAEFQRWLAADFRRAGELVTSLDLG